jgi:hypothetical protein
LGKEITKYYGKVLIIFHTSNTRRTVQIFFPNISNLADIYFTSEYYDTTIREFLEKEEKQRQSKFSHIDLKYKLNAYNLYYIIEEIFSLQTTLGTMFDCYLNNPDVIPLWLSYYPKLDIISLLFKDNESDGYTSKVVESNIPEDNNDKSKKTLFFFYLLILILILNLLLIQTFILLLLIFSRKMS